GAQPSKTYYDRAGRAIKQINTGYNNQQSVVKTEYDQYGRAYRTSIALDSDRAPSADEWQTSTFDILGRVLETTSPSFNGSTLQVSTRYSYFSVIQTHSDGATTIKKSKAYNVAGELLGITDNKGGGEQATSSTIIYRYDAYGQLLYTTDSAVNQVKMEYDALGNKIKTIDPDKGTWEYRYNALGQLKWQKDANGQVTWINYDNLGRVTQRISNAQS
ncbi:RHS repeat protein, partial [Pseudoalteromonas sp. JBTF-M23]